MWDADSAPSVSTWGVAEESEADHCVVFISPSGYQRSGVNCLSGYRLHFARQMIALPAISGLASHRSGKADEVVSLRFGQEIKVGTGRILARRLILYGIDHQGDSFGQSL